MSRGRRKRRTGTRGRRIPVVPILFAFVVGIALGVGVFWGPDHVLPGPPAAIGTHEITSAPVAGTHRFTVCNNSRRYTCVVDGDTFWLEGVKIRIADFNTPEVSQPHCARELELGNRATLRLVELLNQGAFELAPAADGRDLDRYGRRLRIVVRNGRSIGDTLIAEGLAHPWRGRRESWC